MNSTTHTAFSGVKKTRTAMEPFTGKVHDTVVADEDGQKASLVSCSLWH